MPAAEEVSVEGGESAGPLPRDCAHTLLAVACLSAWDRIELPVGPEGARV